MKKWQPSRLHFLLGNQVEWTDALWDEALAFCERNTATPRAICMTAVLPEQQERILFKIDYLRQFRSFPPLTMLYAYDFQRLYFKNRPLSSGGSHLKALGDIFAAIHDYQSSQR